MLRPQVAVNRTVVEGDSPALFASDDAADGGDELILIQLVSVCGGIDACGGGGLPEIGLKEESSWTMELIHPVER